MTYDEALALFSRATDSNYSQLDSAIRLFVGLGVVTINEPKAEPQADPEPDWKFLARNGDKLFAIKTYRQLTGAGIVPAKEAVEAFIAGGCK